MTSGNGNAYGTPAMKAAGGPLTSTYGSGHLGQGPATSVYGGLMPGAATAIMSKKGAQDASDAKDGSGNFIGGYGRQNSDQTSYVRNMRSVLHHNGLAAQKNNLV